MAKQLSKKTKSQLLAISALLVLIWVLNGLHAQWRLQQAIAQEEAEKVEGEVFSVGGSTGTIEGTSDLDTRTPQN